MSAWEIRNALALLAAPPGALLLLMLAGLVAFRRRRRLAIALIGAAWLALYALSTPAVSRALLRSLEPPYADPAADRSGEAIVVLGGGQYHDAPEYGGSDTVGSATLVRLRYAARLYHALGKPVLVTGGAPGGEGPGVAQAMKRMLEHEFDVPVRWVETAAATTEDNASRSLRLLGEAGVKRIYVVTHAWHMKRARWSFERAGFEVIPAPTVYATHPARGLMDFVPDAGALAEARIFVHETLGLAWYRVKSHWGAGAGGRPEERT